jgi:hypothetical protein
MDNILGIKLCENGVILTLTMLESCVQKHASELHMPNIKKKKKIIKLFF